MIHLIKNTTLGKVITFQPESGELADKQYAIQMKVCGNPACDCGYTELAFHSNEEEEEEVVAKISANVHEKTLTLQENVPPLSHSIMETMIEGMQENDWENLARGYYLYKNIISEDFDIEKVDVEFPEEVLRSTTLMQMYLEYLPAAEQFYVEKDENTIILLDYYCINPTCDCTHLYFEVVKEKKGKGIFWYDYKKRQVMKGDNEVPDDEAKNLIQSLREKHEDFEGTIKKRHQNLRALFMKYIQKNKMLRPSPATAKTKISRNAPCPCGSGKKYKRCCGR